LGLSRTRPIRGSGRLERATGRCGRTTGRCGRAMGRLNRANGRLGRAPGRLERASRRSGGRPGCGAPVSQPSGPRPVPSEWRPRRITSPHEPPSRLQVSAATSISSVQGSLTRSPAPDLLQHSETSRSGISIFRGRSSTRDSLVCQSAALRGANRALKTLTAARLSAYLLPNGGAAAGGWPQRASGDWAPSGALSF
jgi:hypothetical protein